MAAAAAVVTYNCIELVLVLGLGAADHDLLEQLACIFVRLDGALEVLCIVEQHCRVRLLQRSRQHRLLVLLPPLPRAGRGALIVVLQPGARAAFTAEVVSARVPAVVAAAAGVVVPAQGSGMISRGRLPVSRTLRCLLRDVPRRGNGGAASGGWPGCARCGVVPCVRLLHSNDGGRSQGRLSQHSLGLAARGRPLAGGVRGQWLRIEVVAGLVRREETRRVQARRRGGVVRRGAGRGVGVVDCRRE